MHHGYGYFEEDHLTPVGELGLWRRILGYARPFWRHIAAAVVLSFVISGATLTLPYLVSIGVDRYITNLDLSMDERLAGLAWISLPFIGLMVFGFLANFLQVVLLEWTGQHIMHQLRQHLFGHVIDLDLSFFNKNPVGKLVTRLTNDIQNMHEMFTSVIVTLFNDLIRMTGILVILILLNWRLALLMMLLIPLIAGTTVWFSRLARDAFRAIRTSLARLNSFLQEVVSGISVIQLFQREEDTVTRFKDQNLTYFKDTMHQIKIFGLFMPVLEVFSALAVALIIWYGGSEIIKGSMTIGVLVAFLSYMRLFFQPVRELSQKYSIVQSAMASAERIFQLLDTKSRLPVPLSPATLQNSEGRLEFRDVTFGYDAEKPVISRFSLVVEPGETIAVVGATGAGKTTLISLLERFYDPQQGEVMIDGIDLRTLAPKQVREQVGLVMQDVFIIPGSVRENILLDRQLDDKELQRIIAETRLKELVGQMPDGLETMIGEGGRDLSAGQRQLLSLARVMARDPRILILDEATSSIDSETEALLERAVEVTLANRTSIVIAHRLSTIRRADRIIVMEGGRIVEQGTHDALMAKKGLYNHLQSLQFAGQHHSTEND